jgi:aryl-alcohol dehydrogenase-like predicted oxidoreductase
MRYINLGNSDLSVSVIGQGTGQFGTRGWGYGSSYNDATISKIIDADLASGINVFDTSETYGDTYAETLLGRNLKKYRRDDFVIITKVAPWNLSYNNILKAANKSLERLKINEIDLYLVHYPNPFLPLRDTFHALEELVQLGKIRHIGVSNFNLRLLKKAQENMRKYEIIANEIEYNLFSRKAENELLPYCKYNHIGVIAFSPLAGGLLTGKYNANNLPTDRAHAFNFFNREKYINASIPLFKTLSDLATIKKSSVAQLALSYLLSEGVMAIPAALTEMEVRENAKASLITLTIDERLQLRKNAKTIDDFCFFFDHFIVRPISWSKETIRHKILRY